MQSRHPIRSQAGSGWVVSQWGKEVPRQTGIVHADLDCPTLRTWIAETERIVAAQTARRDRAMEDDEWDYEHPTYGRSLFEVNLDTEKVITFWDPTIYGRSWSTEGRQPGGWLPLRWRTCLRCGSVPDAPTQVACSNCWLTACDCDTEV